MAGKKTKNQNTTTVSAGLSNRARARQWWAAAAPCRRLRVRCGRPFLGWSHARSENDNALAGVVLKHNLSYMYLPAGPGATGCTRVRVEGGQGVCGRGGGGGGLIYWEDMAYQRRCRCSDCDANSQASSCACPHRPFSHFACASHHPSHLGRCFSFLDGNAQVCSRPGPA
jgi:hypothetical protein